MSVKQAFLALGREKEGRRQVTIPDKDSLSIFAKR